MKLLRGDNKLLNLFDILIISIIVVSAIFLAIFFLRRSRFVTVVVKITGKNVLYAYENPPSWFVHHFREEMVAKDGLGRKTAEIKKVYRYDIGPNMYGKPDLSNQALYLTLSLKADYSKSSEKYSFEGKPLIIGAPIKIEFQDILVEGLITHIEGEVDKRKTKEAIVEARVTQKNEIFPETLGIENYVADAIEVGGQVKNSLGEILITVIDKRVQPAEKIVTDSRGNTFVTQDPLKKDVFLTLKLRVKEVDSTIVGHEYYIFDDIRVKVGNSLPVHLEDISIYPVITKIVEIK